MRKKKPQYVYRFMWQDMYGIVIAESDEAADDLVEEYIEKMYGPDSIECTAWVIWHMEDDENYLEECPWVLLFEPD